MGHELALSPGLGSSGFNSHQNYQVGNIGPKNSVANNHRHEMFVNILLLILSFKLMLHSLVRRTRQITSAVNLLVCSINGLCQVLIM